jgi:hypothetical protein
MPLQGCGCLIILVLAMALFASCYPVVHHEPGRPVQLVPAIE